MSPLSHPIRATEDNLHEVDWDVATLWQLQDRCGNYWICVVVMGSTWYLLEGCYIHPVTVILTP